MKTLGQYLRELRERQDLSLREFAKKLDVSAAFISDVELGRRFPSEEMLARMAKTLGAGLEGLRQFDTRPPVEDLKRLASSDPAFGLALRRVVEKKVTAQDLMNLAKKAGQKKKK